MTIDSIQPDNNKSIPELLARPVNSFDIKTSEGKTFYFLQPKDIGKGIMEGWIKLDDESRKDEKDPWQKLSIAFGIKNLDVGAFVHTQKAFARFYSSRGGIGLSAISFFLSFFYFMSSKFEPSNLIMSIVNGIVYILAAYFFRIGSWISVGISSRMAGW